jgi:hypothetical protein
MKKLLLVVLTFAISLSFAVGLDNAFEKNRQTSKRLISDIYALDGDISSCNTLLSNGKMDAVSGITIPLTRADSQAVTNRKNVFIIKMKSKIDSLRSCYNKKI